MDTVIGEKCLGSVLNVLSEIVDAGVLLIRTDGDIVLANSFAVEALGASSEEELKADWSKIYPLLNINLRLAAADRPQVAYSNLGTINGVRSLRLEVHLLNDGEDRKYLILIRDRCIPHKMEMSLLLASHMRAMSYLHGQLSHDVKSPLHAMQITMELLASNFPAINSDKEFEAKQQRYVGVLREELSRLNHSLQSILNQSAPLNKKPQAFDLREAMKEVISLVLPQARRQRVDLNFQLPENFLHVLGYQDRIKQILMNIAVSRLAAMPQGGSLSIDVAVNEKMIEVAFNDNGGAMDKTMRENVSRLALPDNGNDGTMSLYAARVIAESHGGELIIDASSDRQCSIKVRIPMGEVCFS